MTLAKRTRRKTRINRKKLRLKPMCRSASTEVVTQSISHQCHFHSPGLTKNQDRPAAIRRRSSTKKKPVNDMSIGAHHSC